MFTNPRWAYFLLILPPLFWAGNAVLARGIADMIPPIALAFWRWSIALAILLPLTYKQVQRDWLNIVKDWKIISILGLLGIGLFNTILYTAAHTTSAINISLAQSVMPAVIALISYLMFRDRINRRQSFAVLLCVLGAAYILMRGDWERLQQLSFVEGDLLMLLAVVIYALYSVLLRSRPKVHPLSFLTTTFAVGVIVLVPLYLWELSHTGLFQLNLPVSSSLIYVSLCPSILAYLCWNRGVELIGANRAGLFINLIPLFASLMAVLFLGEAFQGYHVVGIVLIFSGLLLFNWQRDKTIRKAT